MLSDHHRSSSFLFLTVIIFFLIFLLLVEDIPVSLGQEDASRYSNCLRKNFTCGDLIKDVSYPFWGNERPDYCGILGYKLDCVDGNVTEIEILSEKFKVLRINQVDKIMKITSKDFVDACPADGFDTTTTDSSLFNYPLDNLTLYYGCPAFPGSNKIPYRFNCQINETSSPDAYYWSQNHTRGIRPPNFDECWKSIEVPVMQPALTMLVSSPSITTLSSVLREGFDVGYHTAADSISECIECMKIGGECRFNAALAPSFTCICPSNITNRTLCYSVAPAPAPDRKPSIGKKVAIGVGAAVGGSLLTIFLVFLLFRRWRRKNNIDTSSNLLSRSISPDLSLKPDPEKGSAYFQTPIFTYKELEEATNNFDDSKELGDGGFGTVYRGELRDGRIVAVKRLYENNCKRVEQFMNEVTILSLLRHPNLVSLYGCTSRHSRELLLVYEYVPNGTVADHLHGEHANAGLVTWPIRMSIAIESAGALAYLHASDIIHRDVKTNNILLDNNFHVKVADFGLSRLFPTDVTHVSTAPQGTPGYVDPEYYQCYQLTDKSDVYSFGVVLIELISSMPAVDINRHRHEINLSNMAINKIHNHALHELVDSSLGFESDYSVRRMITLVAELAFRCLQQETEMRPSMVEVLQVLKGIEDEGSKVVKAMEVDIPAEDVQLLKNISPFSPDSVTGKWDSISTTPNTSS